MRVQLLLECNIELRIPHLREHVSKIGWCWSCYDDAMHSENMCVYARITPHHEAVSEISFAREEFVSRTNLT